MLSRIFRAENENAAVKRKRQIDTLKIFNDNVLELREDVEYQVQFDAGDTRMAIMVSLSAEFPLEKPVLRVCPPIVHRWCNEHSEIVNAPGLLNFTVHSDLGRVVQAVIREFTRNPPKLLDDNSPVSNLQHIDLAERSSPSYPLQSYELPSTSFNSYYSSQYPQNQYSSTTTNASVYNYNYTNSSDKSFVSNCSTILHNANPVQYSSSPRAATATYTNYPAAAGQLKPDDLFPELEKLSIEQLKMLNDSEDRIDQYVRNHQQLEDLDAAIEDAIDWVEKTASSNLAKEEELKQLKSEVAEKVETVKRLKSRYDELSQQYNKLSETFAPDHIKECLKQAADNSHEQSEEIADDFLNGKIDVERFISSYIECRKLGQARRTKEEKLAHQLNELKRAGY